eukprot:sb/3471573/
MVEAILPDQIPPVEYIVYSIPMPLGQLLGVKAIGFSVRNCDSEKNFENQNQLQSDPDLVTYSEERVLVTKSGWPLNWGQIIWSRATICLAVCPICPCESRGCHIGRQGPEVFGAISTFFSLLLYQVSDIDPRHDGFGHDFSNRTSAHYSAKWFVARYIQLTPHPPLSPWLRYDLSGAVDKF